MPGLTNEEAVPRIMITFRCCFSCPFCSVPKKPVQEIGPEDWIRLMKDNPWNEAVISGGEPLMYDGLFHVLENAPFRIKLYTNLFLLKNEHVRRMNPKKMSLFTSWHPQYRDLDNFIYKIRNLEAHGFATRPHWIRTTDVSGDTIGAARYIEKELRKSGIHFGPQGDQRRIKRPGPGRCRIDRTLVGPDGKRYPCIGLMNRQERSIPMKHYGGVECDAANCATCDIASIHAGRK